MATKAQSRASAKYDKTHTKGIYLKLNKETDELIPAHRLPACRCRRQCPAMCMSPTSSDP